MSSDFLLFKLEIRDEPERSQMFRVSANSKQELENLINAKSDGIILALPEFSIRQISFLDPEDLENTVQKIHEHSLLAAVNAMKMLEEDEIEEAEEFLKLCQSAGVDEIYIADEGWIQLARKMDLIDRLIFQPETLMVNGYDAKFYLDQGLKSVSMAHELTLDEILSCSSVAGPIEILIQGYYSWMSSRRPLLSNYFEEIKSMNESDQSNPEDLKNKLYENESSDNQLYWIQEQKRAGKLPVIEDSSGTTVYSDEPICSYDEISLLKEHGINRFRIDTLFEDDEYGVRQLALYRNILNQKPIEESHKKGSDHLYSMKTVTRKDQMV